MIGELQRRRAELVERSTALRAALIQAAAPIAQKAATADRIVAALRRYPLVIAVTVSAVAFVGTRGLLPWLTRALTLFALLKRI
jgi:type II secretory pathway component PulF